MARPARKRKDDEEQKEKFSLPANFVPGFSSALPEWSKHVSEDLIQEATVKGSPGFEPGPDQAKQVEQMTALGMSPFDISAVLRIEPRLLEKFYKYELETAAARINDRVAKIALEMAMSGALPDMTKFWLKTRAGWKETKEVQMTGAGGGPIAFVEIKRRIMDQIEAEIIDIEISEDKK